MRVAITGSNGLLGNALKNLLTDNGVDVLSGDIDDCNIASYESMIKFLDPSIKYLFNCAAYTNVPKAEQEKKIAYKINAQASGILAKVCLEHNIHLVHFSTDFVFDGSNDLPYVEEDDTHPLNYYGLSKLHGENAIQKKMKDNPKYTIFRLQWLYGNSEKTFFSKLLSIAKKGEKINIVQDELGSPCSVDFVSKTIYECFFKKDPRRMVGKIFHLTHNDYCSRYVCGKYFLDKMGFEGICSPITLPVIDVCRPKYSVMSNEKLNKVLDGKLGTWKTDLNNFIKEIKNA